MSEKITQERVAFFDAITEGCDGLPVSRNVKIVVGSYVLTLRAEVDKAHVEADELRREVAWHVACREEFDGRIAKAEAYLAEPPSPSAAGMRSVWLVLCEGDPSCYTNKTQAEEDWHDYEYPIVRAFYHAPHAADEQGGQRDEPVA